VVTPPGAAAELRKSAVVEIGQALPDPQPVEFVFP
jgi:hypothetical protein